MVSYEKRGGMKRGERINVINIRVVVENILAVEEVGAVIDAEDLVA